MAVTAEACPGCGVVLADPGTVAAPSVGASPGCWAAYGDILAREYGEWGNPPIHRLTADAYGAQHPGEPTAKSALGVAVHLIALYLSLDRGVEANRITREIGRLVADPSQFHWLEPPAAEGQRTVLDVMDARDLRDHQTRVHRWAASVWSAWAEHHDTIRRWAGR